MANKSDANIVEIYKKKYDTGDKVVIYANRNRRDYRNINEQDDILGQGTYGTVTKVTHQATGKLYANKTINKLYDKPPERAFREVIEMSRLDANDYLVKYYCHFFEKGSHHIIMELCSYTLHEDIYFTHKHYSGQYPKLTPEQHLQRAKEPRKCPDTSFVGVHHNVRLKGYFISRELLYGLKYMHNHGRFHRDLKPLNVMIKNVPNADKTLVKITDFGFTKVDEKGAENSLCGAPGFMPPEIEGPLKVALIEQKNGKKKERKKVYDNRVDIHAWAVICERIHNIVVPVLNTDGLDENQLELINFIDSLKCSIDQCPYIDEVITRFERIMKSYIDDYIKKYTKRAKKCPELPVLINNPLVKGDFSHFNKTLKGIFDITEQSAQTDKLNKYDNICETSAITDPKVFNDYFAEMLKKQDHFGYAKREFCEWTKLKKSDKIYTAKHNLTKEEYAFKKITFPRSDDNLIKVFEQQRDQDSLESDAFVMNHQYWFKDYTRLLDKTIMVKFYKQMELCWFSLQEAHDQILKSTKRKHGQFLPKSGLYLVSELLIEIAHSLLYLHNNKQIVYGNLDAKNILIKGYGDCKFVKLSNVAVYADLDATVPGSLSSRVTSYSRRSLSRRSGRSSGYTSARNTRAHKSTKPDFESDIIKFGYLIKKLYNFDLDTHRSTDSVRTAIIKLYAQCLYGELTWEDIIAQLTNQDISFTQEDINQDHDVVGLYEYLTNDNDNDDLYKNFEMDQDYTYKDQFAEYMLKVKINQLKMKQAKFVSLN